MNYFGHARVITPVGLGAGDLYFGNGRFVLVTSSPDTVPLFAPSEVARIYSQGPMVTIQSLGTEFVLQLDSALVASQFASIVAQKLNEPTAVRSRDHAPAVTASADQAERETEFAKGSGSQPHSPKLALVFIALVVAGVLAIALATQDSAVSASEADQLSIDEKTAQLSKQQAEAAAEREARREAERVRQEAAAREYERIEAEKKRLITTWSYYSKEDEMGRGTGYWARVNSLNTLNFGFPYEGSQRAALTLRALPTDDSVLLSIEKDKGQFVCGVTQCRINVRFGTRQPLKFSAGVPSDYDPTVLFIRGYDRFMKGLRAVNKVSIEVQFYQEGTRVLHFDVSNLRWPH